MLTSRRPASGRPTSYGFGLNVSGPGRRREAWHTGGQERVSTVLYLQPDSGLVVVLLSNLQHASLTDLARRVADLLHRGDHGQQEPGRRPRARRSSRPG